MRRNRPIKVAKPALFIYTFARRESLPEAGHTYLRRLWDACAALGMSDAVPELNCPAHFPSDFGKAQPSFQLLAARIDAQRRQQGAYYQALLFGYHDVVGIVACLAPNVADDTLNRWNELRHEWRSKADEPSLPAEVLGETYLFHALSECAAEPLPALGKAVFQSLPGEQPSSPPAPFLTEQGFCWWEGVSCNGRRVMAVLCPKAQEDAATAWLLWQGTEQLAPFARCLLHAAKIRYEQQVYDHEMPQLNALRDQVDRALNALLEQHQRFAADDHFSLAEIVRAQENLSQLQADAVGLLASLSRLKELRNTVQIAARNLQALHPPAHPNAPSPNGSPFSADLARAEWLQEQVGYDLVYLEAVCERAQEAHHLTQLRMEQATQRATRSQNDLSLLQTTLLGALLAALGAIDALQLHLPLPKPLHLPLVAFVAALALALPPLFIRWHEPYQRSDYLFGALLGASTGWLGLAALFHAWNRTPPPLLAISVAALSAMLFALLLYGFDKRQQRQSEPSERRLEPSKSDSGASKSHLGQK